MRISSFFYSVKQGIKNIWRNKMFSIASIATMCACIFLFGLFFIIVSNFQVMVREAEEGVAISVFFDEGISQERIDEIGTIISKRPEVARYDFECESNRHSPKYQNLIKNSNFFYTL